MSSQPSEKLKMKKILLVATLMSLSLSSQAVEISCEQIETTARTIMDARQAGVPLKSIIKIINDNEVMKQIVIQAYDSSKYETDSYKKSAVEKFANEYYVSCLKLKLKEG
jgi:hypothetical protein